ncbi:MAG: prolipoprotein diacylglyceryl transferase [bacterium]
MCGPFIHQIDPVIGEIGGIYLWWYGASYTFGFMGVFFWLKHVRASLQYDMHKVYALTLLMCLGILIGGRFVEVIFYEWPFYKDHLHLIPAVWLGGMSTHGILLGAAIGVFIFCRTTRNNFLRAADELAIAGAFIMGLGRLGNFIDGQISGSITEVCWAVKFPDLEGFRHPVVLYDGIKNLLLVPVLLLIRSKRPPGGVVFGHFVIWYGFLRIFVDYFREYRVEFMSLPPGQEFNIVMTVFGLGLIIWAYRLQVSSPKNDKTSLSVTVLKQSSWIQRLALILVMLFSLVIPSDWTQDVPERYGARHPGLEYSVLYPKIVEQSDSQSN